MHSKYSNKLYEQVSMEIAIFLKLSFGCTVS